MGNKKGYVPWNKGKKMSDEYKQKLSCAQRGKVLSTEHIKAVSLALKGRKLTAGHRMNLSKALFGRRLSEQHKQHISLTHKKLKLSNNDNYKVAVTEIKKQHDKLLRDEVEKYKQLGYRVVTLSFGHVPDAILVKDNKIYGLEVTYGGFRRDRHEEYKSSQMFDDILWICKKRTKIPYVVKNGCVEFESG